MRLWNSGKIAVELMTHKRRLLFFLSLLLLIGLHSCSTGYPETEPGVLRVYPGGDDGKWVYVHKDQTYYDLNSFPEKKEITQVIVASRIPTSDKESLQAELSQIFGDKVRIIYEKELFMPTMYRHPMMIPRPVFF